MSKQEYISRYLIIINYLKRGQASWADILTHLETQSEISGYNYVISQRTFQRDISEIRSMWNCDIQNNKSTGVYFIAESEDEQDENIELLDSFNLFNALSLTNNYSNYIQFESRVPKGTEHIYGLLHAIKNKFVVEIEYHKFYEEKSEQVIINPYLIKQFKGRWYLLCLKVDANDIRTYALDRIKSIDIKKKRFSASKDFDLKNYFNNCFGIITPDWGSPEKIIFNLKSFQSNYIKSYPLHETQRIIKETKEETTFEINVFITDDLIMELLSYGQELEIVSPKILVKQIVTINKNILNKY
ncbi:MAG: WYL domain-containing protein [Bacteroidia bacterium]|nr:WYL domain-containing protein [Bacteroidia bacterium]